MTYSDADIDEALERIAGDVERRGAQPEFHGPAMVEMLEKLRAMEVARRSGDAGMTMQLATAAYETLEKYRPTNATSRSKAVLVEVLVELLAATTPSEP